MFAFEKWHSAVEMRRYAMRFIHHIDGLPDFTSLKFNKYNQYDSMVKPIIAYLESHDVDINLILKSLIFRWNKQLVKGSKTIHMTVSGEAKAIELTSDDLVL